MHIDFLTEHYNCVYFICLIHVSKKGRGCRSDDLDYSIKSTPN